LVDAAELARVDLPPAREDGGGAEVLHEDEALEAEGDDGMLLLGGRDGDVGGLLRREDEGFEAVALARSRAPPGGEVAALVELGEFAGVELVDDVDRLRGDPEGRHELVEGDEVLL